MGTTRDLNETVNATRQVIRDFPHTYSLRGRNIFVYLFYTFSLHHCSTTFALFTHCLHFSLHLLFASFWPFVKLKVLDRDARPPARPGCWAGVVVQEKSESRGLCLVFTSFPTVSLGFLLPYRLPFWCTLLQLYPTFIYLFMYLYFACFFQ